MLGGRLAPDLQAEEDVLGHAQVREEGVGLEHHRDAACAGATPVTSQSSMRMPPAGGVSSPAIIRRVVDLPQPEGPRRTTSLPEPVAKVARSTALAVPSAC